MKTAVALMPGWLSLNSLIRSSCREPAGHRRGPGRTARSRPEPGPKPVLPTAAVRPAAATIPRKSRREARIDEPSDLMPDVTKLLMKRRWNSRKPISSGATTRSVPAAMTPQACAPSWPRVNAASPTVRGRLSGELMTIKGHRKLVPMRRHRDDGEGQERRQRQWHVHMTDALQDRGAVDQGGVLQLARDRLERLAHEEGAEGRGEVGCHHAGQRVVEAEPRHHRQVRHDQNHGHQHQLQQKQVEERLLAGKHHPSEGIASERDGHDLDGQDAESDDDRIEIVAREIG